MARHRQRRDGFRMMTTRNGWETSARGGHPTPAAFLRAVARAEVNVLTYAPAMAQVATVSGLDERAHAMVKLAATIAMDAPSSVYSWQVNVALKAGVTEGELIGLLAAVSPVVGSPRTVAAAGRLAFALGIDTGPNAGETDEGA
jgi:alkylhydroperoxidase/carboxymuconolactone decarboxylase family protein YurZ